MDFCPECAQKTVKTFYDDVVRGVVPKSRYFAKKHNMLAREHRLRKEKDIKTLFTKGKSVFGVSCGIKMRANDLPYSRFTVVVGAKVSKKAVVRNRLRRILREEIRLCMHRLQPGFDVLLLVRPGAKELPPATLRLQLHESLVRAHLLKD